MRSESKVRCGRCGKRLKKGGNNYRMECIIVSDFNGHINIASPEKDWQETVKEIEMSGLTQQELEEQVFYKLNQKLCFDCRCEVVDFLKRNG